MHIVVRAPLRKMKMKTIKTNTHCFTLTELLIVISVFAILLALLVPSLKRALTLARISTCTANLKSTAVGVNLYTGDNQDYLPAGMDGPKYINWMDQIQNYLIADENLKLTIIEKQSLTISESQGIKFLFCPSEVREYKVWDAVQYRPCFTYVMPSSGSSYIGAISLGAFNINSPMIATRSLNQLNSPDQIALLTENARSPTATDIWSLNQGGYYDWVNNAGAVTRLVPQNPETMAMHNFSLNYLFVDGHTVNLDTFDPTQWGTGTMSNPNGIYSVAPND